MQEQPGDGVLDPSATGPLGGLTGGSAWITPSRELGLRRGLLPAGGGGPAAGRTAAGTPPAPAAAGLDVHLLMQVVESLPDATTLSTAVRDPRGRAVDMRLVYMNAAARVGQPHPERAIGELASELWPPMVRNGSLAACLQVLDTGETCTGEFWWSEQERYRTAGYDYKAVRVGADMLLWVLRDSTERVRRMAEQEARFRGAFEAAPAGMALVALDGTWLDVNESLAAMLGRPAGELIGCSFSALSHPEDVGSVDSALPHLVSGRENVRHVDQRMMRADGAVVWTRLSVTLVTGSDDRPLYFVAHVLDVTETRRAQAELAFAATHDALTGLPNRLLLLDRIATALRRARRSSSTSAVLMVDLDHFKVINDSLGHLAGDQVLRVVAARISSAVRPGDTTARLGGDEFVVFCDDLDPVGTSAQIEELTTRICDRLSAPIPVEGQQVVVAASIGAALADAWDPIAEDLLRDADVALYDAKRRGRGSFSLFDRQMRVRALERLDVESSMRQALETDAELFPYFQPIIDVDSGRVVAVEALARWRRGGALASPSAFLEVAEESGLIVRLSEHIARLAAAQVATWRDSTAALDGDQPLRLCVNVSPKQLAREDFVDRTTDMLALTGLPAGALVVEITEDTLLQAGPHLDRTLARLHDIGIRIALDDFGTGYSSLAYLQQLPVDILKIDRAFVVSAVGSVEGTTLLHTFAELGRALNLNVVVEGVETAAQLDVVRSAGCQLVQGYLLGRPAAAPDLARRALVPAD